MNRILFISHERKMGGANFALYELVKELQDAGNQVSVVVLYKGCPIDKELKKGGIKTFPCFFGWWQQPENWSFFLKWAFRLLHWLQWISVIRISKFVRKEKIQIIHSNSSVIDIGAQVAEKTGCKHVWHFREFGAEHYHFEYMCGRDKAIEYIQNHCDKIVFISNALRDAYSDIKMNNKVTVIYDGIVSAVDAEKYIDCDVHKRNDSEECNFLVAGAISPGKNQKVVLEAVKILVRDMGIPEEQFHVFFAGAVTALKESRCYMEKMEQYINLYGLNNVSFVGFVHDMTQFRKKMHVAIIPSMYEAYGRVTLEAMLNRELVLASNSGSNSELIGKDERGLLFDCMNPNELALKMQHAISNEETERKEKAQRYVCRFHTREEACKNIQNVYNEIVGVKM